MQVSEFNQLSQHVQRVLGYNWLFIGGAEKSGTTWLQRLLDAHPEIRCNGEGHFIDTFMKGVVENINHYNHVLHKTATDVYAGKPYYKPSVGQKALDTMQLVLIASLIPEEHLSENIRYLGDKTPANSRYFAKLHHLFPRAKCIHIVRDPRDMTVSLMHHMQRTEEPEKWTFDVKTDVCARHWAGSVGKAIEFGKQHPNDYFQLQYEELKSQPLALAMKLLDFLEVDASEATAQSCIDATDFKRMSGGRKPGEEDNRSFLRKGVVGDWKNHLQEPHLAIIEKHCGELMKQLGYAESSVEKL